MEEALKVGKVLKDGEYYTRGQVAREISDLILPAYMLGLNPLQHFRRIFPSFIWNFHNFYVDGDSNPNLLRLTQQMVANADIFWEVNDFEDHVFVTARLAPKKLPPMRLYGNNSFRAISKHESRVDGGKLVRSIGGQDIGD